MMTSDDERFLLLNAYRDGELSAGEALDMERQLAADPALRAMADRLASLSAALAPALDTPPAPAALRGRIVQQLGFNDAAPRRRMMSQPWQSLAAVLLVGLVAGGLLGSGATYLGLGPGQEGVTEAVLAGHLRGLAAPQPYDIASSNRHVVKPWFNGRTTIAPQAPDFAEQGYPLAGGRIDVVEGKAVPTLVYRRDQHVISVTITPAISTTAAAELRRGGSTIERWSTGDLTDWAVSDVEAKALRDFTALFRAQTADGG